MLFRQMWRNFVMQELRQCRWPSQLNDWEAHPARSLSFSFLLRNFLIARATFLCFAVGIFRAAWTIARVLALHFDMSRTLTSPRSSIVECSCLML